MRAVCRRLSGACLILFALVVGGLPVADAIIGAPAWGLSSNVEDGKEGHRGTHDHVDCLLCRAIDRNVATGGGDAFALATPAAASRAPHAAPDGAPRQPARSVHGARAPPRA
ncbi:MAG TPA: hypothetical protein VMM18_13745 [Gemmatimonadaceae bacterium]|nr:hypothetical protein [Gemmatimonadaceae bacterium]